MGFVMAAKKEGFKEEILKHLEAHKETLGEDYFLIRGKVLGMKDEFMSKEEIRQAEDWIKKHPFLSVAFALIMGAAMHKILAVKGD